MKTITAQSIAELAARAAELPRQRSNINLHPELSDPIQRMVAAGQPGSYVRPHRHSAPGRWELFCLLAGELDLLIFDAKGVVQDRVRLRQGGTAIVEIPHDCWHSLLFMAKDSAGLELKPGPYAPSEDKDFAAWAPAEGQPGAAELLAWMREAAVGTRWR